MQPSSSPEVSLMNAHNRIKRLFFGLSRRPLGYAASTAKRCVVQTADADGVASFTFGSTVPRSSIYAAVDYESGAYSIATPSDYPLRLIPFPIAALRKRGEAYTN